MARRPAAPSRTRLLLATLLVAGALAPVGCADKEPTGIVLVLDSQSPPISEPDREIDHIQIDWEYDTNADTIFNGSLVVARNDSSEQAQIPSFPGSITFQADPDTDSATDRTLSLRITAFFSTRDGKAPRTIFRAVKARFADQKLKALPVTLEMACLAGAATDDSESKDAFGCDRPFFTCVAGSCQPNNEIDNSQLDDYSDAAFQASIIKPACFDASSSQGCFQGAQLVPASGIRLDPDDLGRCDFDIPGSALSSIDSLSLAVVWPEGHGRASLINRSESSGAASDPIAWTAVPQELDKGIFKVTLPTGVCRQLRRDDGSGRATGILYAARASCPSKTARMLPCLGTTESLLARESTCQPSSNVIDSDDSDDDCLSCLREVPSDPEATSALTTCLEDASCQRVLDCKIQCFFDNAGPANEDKRLACIAGCDKALEKNPGCGQEVARANAVATEFSGGKIPKRCVKRCVP